jgi:putative transposase
VSLYQGKYRIEPARLRNWDYSSRGWYFVTMCTQNRVPIFGEVANDEVRLSKLGLIADSELRTLPSHYENVEVDIHVVMPNHVHALIMIDGDHRFTPNPRTINSAVPRHGFHPPEAGSLSVIVRSYKAGVTKRSHECGFQVPIWQPRFYDHLLRGDSSISAVRDYIRNNPANWAEDKENLLRFR